MLVGKDLISLRKNKKDIKHKEIRALIGCALPPKLTSFLENYEWSDKFDSDASLIYFPEPRIGDLSRIGEDPIDIINFTINSGYDEVNEFGGIMIFGSRRGVIVGIKEENQDQVYAKNSSDQEFMKVANDIFQFIEGLTDTPIEKAESENEYKLYLQRVGYEGEELDKKTKHWELYRKHLNSK